jgi:hypothetical protein
VRDEKNDRKPSSCEGHWNVVTLYLTSKKMGQKAIASLERCNEEFSHDDNMTEVVGYFKSPYEKRIVIVTAGRRYVLENEYENQIQIFGAHLGVGFKQ